MGVRPFSAYQRLANSKPPAISNVCASGSIVRIVQVRVSTSLRPWGMGSERRDGSLAGRSSPATASVLAPSQRAAGEALAKTAIGRRGRLAEIVVSDAPAAQVDLGDQSAVGGHNEGAVGSPVDSERWKQDTTPAVVPSAGFDAVESHRPHPAIDRDLHQPRRAEPRAAVAERRRS
jgi:hypothetical protein